MPSQVGGFTALVAAASKTRPANTTAYSIGQVVSESTSVGTAWILAGCARAGGAGNAAATGTGAVVGAMLTDIAAQTTKPQLELWLFTAPPACSMNDAATFSPTAADLAALACAPIAITTANYGDATGVIQASELNRLFKCAAGKTILYGVLVTLNTYTPVSGEVLDLTLFIRQD